MSEEKNYVLLKAFLILVLFLMSGCGGGSKPRFTEEELAQIPLAQREGFPKCSGGFVLAVGGETITADEVIAPLIEHLEPIAQRSDFERFKEQAGPQVEQILITKVSNILLYQQAKRQADEQVDEALEKAAEAEVEKFIVGFEGDYARAEDVLKQMGMDWASFKEYQKKMILSQSYIASQLPENKPVTYSELLDGYNEMKEEFFAIPAMLKFRLIDIEAAKLELSDPNQNRQEQVRELANELLRRIQADEDFGKLAEEYSEVSFIDHSDGVQPENLEKPYDILAAESERIEPGQIAGPIETGEHIFIMKLVEKQPKSVEPFEKVQKEVEAKINFDRRKQAVDELNAKLVRQAALTQKDEFIDFCLRKIYRMSNQ